MIISLYFNKWFSYNKKIKHSWKMSKDGGMQEAPSFKKKPNILASHKKPQ